MAQEQKQRYDVIIVGGGAAALSAAIYTCRADLHTIIFERKAVGGQVIITADVDNYPGFPEGILGPDLIERMERQAKRFGVEIRYEEVVGLKVDGCKKVIITDSGTYISPIVILAMGADPRRLNVPGEAEFVGRGVSYCGICDGPFYRDKDVVVVGGGDSSLTEAIFLTKFVKSIIIIHRRNAFRAEKILQKEVFNNPKIDIMWNTVIEGIYGNTRVEEVSVRNIINNKIEKLSCNGIFVCIGHTPNTGFLGGLFSVDPGSHIETDNNMETSIKGIYAIGDVRMNSFKQIATAIGEGATAAIAAELRIAEMKAKGEIYEGV